MIYGSVCSGIEAASVAWHPLGWRPAFYSEIEPFPRAVLAHHHPDVPCHGDFTTIGADEYGAIDLLVGGTPCQSFSIAGLRGGLDDDRGNLALEFLRLADRKRPRWLVWENVPGVLSSNGGRDFGSILGGMVELGYGIAYRVLDAQHFGVPQRRRRVFVVGYLGDWRRSAAVLFERHSLSGHPAPRRQKGQVAPTIPSRSSAGGGLGTDFDCDGGLIERAWPAEVAPTLNAAFGSKLGLEDQHIRGGADCSLPPLANTLTRRMHKGINTTCDEGQTLIPTRGGGFDDALGVAHSLTARHDSSPDGTGRGTPLVPVAFALRGREGGAMPEIEGDQVGALRAANGGSSRSYIAGGHAAVAFTTEQTPKFNDDVALTLTKQSPSGGGQIQSVMTGMTVRRLTPTECERLQGFPDGWTLVPVRGKPAADGPRYKALGNSMAVPVMRWIGERIQMVEALEDKKEAAA